ncbi:hypothetical protein J4G52_37000 [Burkholderia cenocepacia]|uniref:DISARM anti-phage system protein DrmE domain-containing protein n=1 Tax=Burkholderia cenocepacia TaxID=95486 RepID=UPI001AA132B0|nr:hypothetical protein [Burkholderia cenocepacia]MBO1859158.1 hypothetical protein [Burkholderia cenocepacia]MDR5643424.1 hypothetical protein [Burkholderia cenocepacia]
MTPAEGPAWVRLIRESWPAVPGRELLSSDSGQWQQEGLAAPSDAESRSWAAVGRCVRYGASIAVRMPVLTGAMVTRLSVYLHRLRLDAEHGFLRASWLNPLTIADRTDLVVFGRPSLMLTSFATSSALRPVLLARCKGRDDHRQHRTLLASGHGDLLETVQRLENVASPFALLVDITSAGCGENAEPLVGDLQSRFPGVPVVAIGHTGDLPRGRQLPMHQWNMRLSDCELREAGISNPITVVCARDTVMDAFVKRLSFLAYSFRQLGHGSGATLEQTTAVRAIERGFRSLNVPYAVSERAALSASRAGLYAIRPVERWIEIAGGIKAWRGDVEKLLQQFIETAREGAHRLENAVPGRVRMILELTCNAIGRGQTVGILTGNESEAGVLARWIEDEVAPESVGLVTVGHMDGASSYTPACADVLLFVAPLFPSRLHWLALPASERFVVCHPFETAHVGARVQTWLEQHALPSAQKGDKCRLWSLEWPNEGFLNDDLTETQTDGTALVETSELPLDGFYSERLQVMEFEVPHRHSDWLDALLEDHHPDDNERHARNTAEGSGVVVHIEGHVEPFRWPDRRQILTLAADELIPVPAIDLKPGVELVLLLSSEGRVATQREIFEMFVTESHGLQQTLRIAEKWQEYVDAAVSKSGSVASLTRYLKSQKFDISAAAVQNWAGGKVIGPQDPTAIRLVAQAAGHSSPPKMASMIARAIEVIRSEHRRIGTDLRNAIAVTRSRAIAAVTIGSRTFPRETFDAMVEIARVTRVDRPPVLPDTGRTSLAGIAKGLMNRHPERIVFTPACERSMNESPFENHEAFADVLSVMIGPLFEMYSSKTVRLSDVEDRLASIPADYAGDTSDVTKGKYRDAYFRQWEGRRIDISRHIKLGRLMNPRYTMRIHFHWDEDSGRIVVHHAGHHLPTARTG